MTSLGVSPTPHPIANEVQSHLNRSLSRHEMLVLTHLSPQGIAKINHDVCAGKAIEVTLKELKTAFDLMSLQRRSMDAMASPTLKKLVAKMGRPVSTAELVFLTRIVREQTRPEVSAETIIAELMNGNASDEDKNDEDNQNDFATIVEERMLQIHQKQRDRVEQFHAVLHLPVWFTTLAPTSWNGVYQISQGVCFHHAVRLQSNMIEVGLNPLTTWFVDDDNEDDEKASTSISDKISVPSLPLALSTLESEDQDITRDSSSSGSSAPSPRPTVSPFVSSLRLPTEGMESPKWAAYVAQPPEPSAPISRWKRLLTSLRKRCKKSQS